MRQHRIRFIQGRHEESAAFMACAYAKYTGRLVVCLVTPGPGGLHLLNGLYDARLDGAPVLAITGHHFHDLIDTRAQQDCHLVCTAYSRQAQAPVFPFRNLGLHGQRPALCHRDADRLFRPPVRGRRGIFHAAC